MGSHVSQDAFSDLPLPALAEWPRQAGPSLDVSPLATAELRRALLSHLPDTGQEVLVAWPTEQPPGSRTELRQV